MSPPEEQRLDKWLWYARIVKSRSIAAKLIEDGCIRVNRQRAVKASATVKCGDVVTATLQGRVRVIEIRGLGERRGPAARRKCFIRNGSCPARPPPPKGPKSKARRNQHTILDNNSMSGLSPDITLCTVRAAKRQQRELTHLPRYAKQSPLPKDREFPSKDARPLAFRLLWGIASDG